MKKLKNNIKGITLVALVITIIILLILAGITISSLTNTGLFGKAKEAKNLTQEKTAEEKVKLNSYEEQIGIVIEKKEKCTVTFNANGGDGIVDSQTNTVGFYLILPENKFIAPTDYSFVSWNTRADGTGEKLEPGEKIKINEDITIYAIWEKKRYYLFKDGDECTDITGGWDVTYPGYRDSPNWSKIENNKVFYSGKLTTIGSSHGNAIVTNKPVNLNEFSKICLNMEIKADKYSCGSIYGQINFGKPKAISWPDSNRWNCSILPRIFRDNENFGKGLRTYKFDIDSQERQSVYIYIIANNNPPMDEQENLTITNEEVYVYDIWLEK